MQPIEHPNRPRPRSPGRNSGRRPLGRLSRLAGLGRAKAVPRGRFRRRPRGRHIRDGELGLAITDEQGRIPSMGRFCDFRAVPDPSTLLAMPNRPASPQAFGIRTTTRATMWPGDPRGVLTAQVGRLERLDTASRSRSRRSSCRAGTDPTPLLTDTGRMFAVGSGWPMATGRADPRRPDAAGIAVHQFAKSTGRASSRSLLHAPPLVAADRSCSPANSSVRCAGRGYDRLVHAKPYADLPGNGSRASRLARVEDPEGDLGWRRDDPDLLARRQAAIAGLLAHQPPVRPVLADPELVQAVAAGSWAPAHVCWRWAIGRRWSRPGRVAGRHWSFAG